MISYKGLHQRLTAVYELGGASSVLAAKEEEKAVPKIPLSVFRKAANHIHHAGGFSAEMLPDEPIRELIDRTADCLMQGVDFGLADNVIPKEMSEKLEHDVFVFSGCKTYQELREASQLLRDERGQIKPFRAFFEEVKALHPTYNEQYLEAEHGFAVHSAQAAAKWAQIEQDGDAYDLQYRTAGDGLVRPAHAALNGVTLPPSDPFWLKYMTPNGSRCRCNVVQVRKGKYSRSESAEAIERGDKATTDIDGQGRNRAEMFRFNPGKERVVFPKNHPYYQLPAKDRQAIEQLTKEADE